MIRKTTLVLLALFPLAAYAAHDAPGHEAAPPAAYSEGFIRVLLLAILWLFIAAAILGPLVMYFVGDLWKRRTPQIFEDDAGGHRSHHAPAAGHH